ncbi:NAD(P)/FAD-dependent oxidoreductase [Demequina sp. NBRC 110056]|uniref:flavin-containing monooxygenase n=1 Tax=Demequina sp. NBRC 110056 TaxID=1570345 RepID=UPI001F2C5CDC|nr:NAD(P)/FAD-dependent oxidoreductase [Demequina sp. NBRC 110056]
MTRDPVPTDGGARRDPAGARGDGAPSTGTAPLERPTASERTVARDASAALPDSVPILVVGAGQAGLSVGYHLLRRGLEPAGDFLIVDRGPGAGGAWQHRWDTLRLGDAHRIADLPGMGETGRSFDSAPTEPPAAVVVGDYYARYEDAFALDVARPVDVTDVRTDADGTFVVSTADARADVRTRVLVAAVGTWGSPRLPDVPGVEDFRGRQIVTPEFRSPADFAGLRVAIVGGGASALGFLREVSPVATGVRWFTRRPPAFSDPAKGLSEDLGRESVRLQDEAARAGRELPSIVSTTGMPLTPRLRALRDAGLLERSPMFARVVTDGVVHADGTFEPFDAIIWAIGFHADLGPLRSLGLDARRGVRVADGHALDVPGLFLAGYGPQASTISANRGARRIARDAQRYLSDGRWPPAR